MFLFELASKEAELSKLEVKIAKDGFWDDLENSQKSKNLNFGIDKYNKLKGDMKDIA